MLYGDGAWTRALVYLVAVSSSLDVFVVCLCVFLAPPPSPHSPLSSAFCETAVFVVCLLRNGGLFPGQGSTLHISRSSFCLRVSHRSEHSSALFVHLRNCYFQTACVFSKFDFILSYFCYFQTACVFSKFDFILSYFIFYCGGGGGGGGGALTLSISFDS